MQKSVEARIHYQFDLDIVSERYPIVIGENLLSSSQLITPHIRGKQVMIVSNALVASHYLSQVRQACAGYEVDEILIPEGEGHKTLTTVDYIITALLEAKHHRNTTLIALGGGMIGDVTGFVASCYQRGVSFLQLPTTLLAQVDAAIGGKTAVNHRLGKNLIGAFHQPKLCLIDIKTLQTLSDREYRAGIAEVVKAALIRDAEFFTWLEENVENILQRDAEYVSMMIYRACLIKAQIVSEDVYEQGNRALLNLGHTFAHAIETTLAYQDVLHGEAVAIGCYLAAQFSVQQRILQTQDAERIKRLLLRFGFDLQAPPICTPNRLVESMLLDKKNQDNTLRLVLLTDVGTAVIVPGINSAELIQFLEKNR